MPIYVQVKRERERWREIWYAMAGGVQGEYDRIKGLDVLEFWSIYDLWRLKMQTEKENHHKKRSKNGK